MTYEQGLLAEADRLLRTVTSLRRRGGVSFVRCVAGPSAGYHRVQNHTFNLTTFFFFFLQWKSSGVGNGFCEVRTKQVGEKTPELIAVMGLT